MSTVETAAPGAERTGRQQLSLPASLTSCAILRGMNDPKPDGPEVVYYDNGNVKQRGGYLDGEMHGPWEFFRRDGSTLRSGIFDRGRQVGTWRSYDRESIVTRETEFPAIEE